jgi:hypothetical protein
LAAERGLLVLAPLLQVDARGAAARHLLPRRARVEPRVPGFRAGGDRGTPEDGLADARLAPDEQGPGPSRHGRDERLETTKLGLPPDDGGPGKDRPTGTLSHGAIIREARGSPP